MGWYTIEPSSDLYLVISSSSPTYRAPHARHPTHPTVAVIRQRSRPFLSQVPKMPSALIEKCLIDGLFAGCDTGHVYVSVRVDIHVLEA